MPRLFKTGQSREVDIAKSPRKWLSIYPVNIMSVQFEPMGSSDGMRRLP